jgi:23S rRNA (cytosine1962-C5)-methyltransferase
VRVPRSTAGPVGKGHPWVFREPGMEVAAGQFLRLIDDAGRTVGWGLGDLGPIAVRVLGRGELPDDPMAEVARRLRDADEVRRRTIAGDTDAWRVCHGEGDGLPGLVIDRYGDHAIVKLYASGWERWLEPIASVLLGLPWCRGVSRRLGVRRVDGDEGLAPVAGAPCPDVIVVSEYGMRMLVRPAVGQKTGLFLDQREHRALVRRFASGLEVVNLFGYTGGFSLAAALGGAPRVTTVDIAPEAIEDARENFRLNGLDPARHGFEVADVFAWRPPRPITGMLVVDPPSLSHAGGHDAAARKAYEKLHVGLGPWLLPGAWLATSSCTARLRFDAWQAAVADGLCAAGGDWSWHWESGAPTDHPVALVHTEARYLKFGLLRRR